MSKTWVFLFASGFLALTSGCAVPQPRGAGQYARIQEPGTKAWYHLYLPVDYVKNNGIHPNSRIKKWPLVMTFHGMKPYDNAAPQEREWEQQADIYGYIVCAPELNTSNSFMEYPLTKEHSYVLEDKRNVVAIMDHVLATTYADPKKVLSTSWSCGGYLAHYFPNRFPDRFTCIATRLSNFSPALMVEETIPYYRDRVPVAVFIGDGDFPKCKSESEEAVAWYTARGFRVVRGKMIDNMGHSRIPQTAAAFFAEQIGVDPIHPSEAAKTVGQVQMTEYNPPPEMVARLSPPSGAFLASAARSDTRRSAPVTGPIAPPTVPAVAKPIPATPPPRQQSSFVAANAGKHYPVDKPPKYDPSLPNEAERTAKSSAPTSLNGTKIASADRPRNWLEPTKGSPQPTAAPTAGSKSNDSKSTSAGGTGSKTAGAVKPIPGFSPQNAGSRDYDRLMESRPQDGNSRSATATPRSSSRAPQVASASPTSSHRKARRVSIKINGPAIGTAPHYLRYSVDLPREQLSGADFLWMDNGVWIGDESSGIKILESPGLHFITVLVVTKDDTEYRGQAKVQVLERAPTAALIGPKAEPGDG